jgi:hypothetical protein
MSKKKRRNRQRNNYHPQYQQDRLAAIAVEIFGSENVWTVNPNEEISTPAKP